MTHNSSLFENYSIRASMRIAVGALKLYEIHFVYPVVHSVQSYTYKSPLSIKSYTFKNLYFILRIHIIGPSEGQKLFEFIQKVIFLYIRDMSDRENITDIIISIIGIILIVVSLYLIISGEKKTPYFLIMVTGLSLALPRIVRLFRKRWNCALPRS